MSGFDQLRVASAFNRADDYASNAVVQRVVAAELAEQIAMLDLPDNPRVLELGCGTGFLTRELLDCDLGGSWLITDKAPAMVERCRAAIGEASGRTFAVLDGEYGLADVAGRYDLICAGMVMQWFDDLDAAVARLIEALAPGGHLVFNTLAESTFAEWVSAHERCGLRAGAVAFPPVDALLAMLGEFAPASLTVKRHVEHNGDARQFLQRLKLIGASTARADHEPLSPGDLRRVMAEFDRAGAMATYEVVTCHIAR